MWVNIALRYSLEYTNQLVAVLSVLRGYIVWGQLTQNHLHSFGANSFTFYLGNMW